MYRVHEVQITYNSRRRVVEGTGTSIKSVGRQEVQKPELLYKGYKNIRQWRIRQWVRGTKSTSVLFAPLEQLALSGTSVVTIHYHYDC